MKISPDDVRLSNYVAGELSAAERAAVDRAMASSPVIRNTVNDLHRVVRILEESVGGDPLALDAVRRERVLAAARQADRAELSLPLASGQRNWRAWWVSGAAAAGVAAALVILAQIPVGDGKGVGLVRSGEGVAEDGLRPVAAPQGQGAGAGSGAGGQFSGGGAGPGGGGGAGAAVVGDVDFLERVRREADAGVLPAAGEFPELSDVGFRAVAGTVEVALPLLSGKSSWSWIRRYVEERESLPPVNAVRIEEMLNAFGLGKVDGAEGMVVDLEVGGCPWDPTSVLALVQVNNPGPEAVAARLSASLDGEAVIDYRLVGYADFKDAQPAEDDVLIASGGSHYLLIEMHLKDPAKAGVEVTLRGEKLLRRVAATSSRSWGEASVDFRFASLVACFGKALRAGGESAECDALRHHLAVFSASAGPLEADRSEALMLMRRSLDLMEETRR